jgi:nitrogen regulatory protein PII
MKMVIAYVQSFMAPAVVDALRALPEPIGATLTKAQGFGRSRTKTGTDTDEGEFVGTRHQVRVEVLAPDALALRIVKIIETTAHTGNPGDGKICVIPVDHVVRVRTGEVDDRAL